MAGDIKVNGISFGRGGGNIPTNTALGRAALALNITGSFNVAVGDSALYNNNAGALFATQGVYNIAVGPKALFKHSFGAHNQAMGFQALYNNQSGVNNVAIGSNSLYTNTGNDNTAVGYNAAYSGALAYKNTAIGSNALLNNTGSNNTAVGYNADIFINWSNSTAIGYNAFCSGSNQVRIGDNNIVSIGGTVSWSNLSDARVKRNIRANIPGLSFINLLKPVTYTFDLDAVDKITKKPEIKDIQGKTLQPSKEDIKAKNEKERIIYSGFLAQQVEQAAKSIGYDFSGIDIPKNDKDAYGLRYAEFVVPLVKAVQELSMASDAKDKRIDELEAKLSRLEKLITPAPAAASLNQQPAGSLSIKPNPVSTALIVTGLNGKGFITILSADGIQLQRKQVSSTTLSMQVASLLPGTYFLQYADGQNIQAISFIRQ